MVDYWRSAPVAALLIATLIFHFSSKLCGTFFAVSSPLEAISANPGLTQENWPIFLDFARSKALLYAEELPNFTCTQITRRYIGQATELTLPTGVSMPGKSGSRGQVGGERGLVWARQDEMVHEVIYGDQQEHYRLLKGPRNAELLFVEGEKQGLTSAGEFGSTLKSLFDRKTQAEFHLEKVEKIRGWKTARAKFRVSVDNSDREIVCARQSGQTLRIKVAYQGQVWFELVSGQVVRLQSAALDIPSDFPIARSTWAIDYDLVGIGGKRYWLPIQAELRVETSNASELPSPEQNLRTRNVIEFKRYRKFGTEVRVLPE